MFRQSAVTECWQSRSCRTGARHVAEAKTDGIKLSLRTDQTNSKVEIHNMIGSSRFGFGKSALTEIKLGAQIVRHVAVDDEFVY